MDWTTIGTIAGIALTVATALGVWLGPRLVEQSRRRFETRQTHFLQYFYLKGQPSVLCRDSSSGTGLLGFSSHVSEVERNESFDRTEEAQGVGSIIQGC